MRKADTEYIIVGKVGSSYGIQGWLKIYPFTEILSSMLDYKSWYLEEGDHWKAITVKNSREHGKCLVAKLEGVNNPEQAKLLTGKKIAIKRIELPVLAKNEYYWADLEGLTVINQRGETLGKISYLLATGANDVLVVKDNNNKEHAIPYLPGKVITQVDLNNQVIHVDWELI